MVALFCVSLLRLRRAPIALIDWAGLADASAYYVRLQKSSEQFNAFNLEKSLHHLQSPGPKSTGFPFRRSSMICSIFHSSYLYPGG